MGLEFGLTRRTLVKRSGQAVGGAGAAWLSGGAAGTAAEAWAAAPDAAPVERITVTEATNASAVLSSDGRTIVLDLLGLLWTLPATGGDAVRLTGIEQEATVPDLSPDGTRIVFQSYADGNFHLWLMNADGTGSPRRLTSGTADHREPQFSPDGERIAYAAETDAGRYAVHVLDLASGRTQVWTQGDGQEAQPAWTPDGSAIAFTTGTADAPRAIDLVDASGARRTLATVSEGRVAGPSFSPDGARLAYVHLTPARTSLVVDGESVTGQDEGDEEDVFPFAARWISDDELLYTAGGRLRRRTLGGRVRDIPFAARLTVPRVAERPSARDFDSTARREVKGILSPALSPDGARVAFAALGDIWIMRRGAVPKAVVSDGHRNTAPAWAPDGRALVYSSDRGGTPGLWLHDLDSGEQRRLTGPELSADAPAFSPDGRTVAFVGNGATLHTVEVANGNLRKVAGPFFAPGRPSFTADGRRIAGAVVVPVTPRFREGRNQILTVDLDSGEAHYSEPVPGASLDGRFDSGPVHSPDGTSMACVIGGTLRVVPIDAAGRPTGPARQVGDETADAPSWSGDSRSLLYLSNGRLRLTDAVGGRVRAVPVKLTWRPTRPTGRTVIQVGALWDGTGPRLRRDVDITLEGHRIAAVTPRGTGASRPGDRIVDARHLTAMPGLISVHEHGPWPRNDTSRLWLSFGITSLRSPGTAHYAAVEAKEAVESGRRTGPRVFAAGDLIEGSRVSYNVVRSVTGTDGIQREISKAKALGHDMVKTYVRLPYALQRKVIEAAHELGLPTSSHDLFGPLGLGADGVEHIGGTSRYGRRQKETWLCRSYQDVTEPLIRSGLAFTPTLGLPATDGSSLLPGLYRHAERALDDPRLTGLMAATEYEIFRKGVERARAEEPTVALALLRQNGETVSRMIGSGANVVIGTDSSLVPAAVTYHLNLQALVRYGASPYDALRCATAHGARALGLSAHLGTVRPGSLADLALVEGDPLTDIAAAAAVRQVVADGTVHSVDGLLAEAAEAAPAPKAAPVRNAVLPEVPQAPARDAYWWHREQHAPRSCC
ncbi:amidohydrolase family protein [Streptomyces sp. NPDC004647]|uniref:amidohydrolase family protein n=1 Tax=Streptomyces sp. NPDC004647 TaxID=3154671 RepID=UPI0033A68E64